MAFIVTLEADEEAFRGFFLQGIQYDNGSRIIGSFRFVDTDTGASMDCLDGFDVKYIYIYIFKYEYNIFF